MLSQILKILSQLTHLFCLLFLLYRGIATYMYNATTAATAVNTTTTTTADAGTTGGNITGTAGTIINTHTVTTATVCGGTATTTCTVTAAGVNTRPLKHNPILKYLHPPPVWVVIA